MPAKYLIDKNNRLLLKKEGEAVPLNGSFSLDEKNRLIYWLNEPLVWRRKYHLPGKIVFCGNWKLNTNHDLELEIQQARLKARQEPLVLKAKIISAETDKLVFEIKSTDRDGLLNFRILQLTGVWQADDLNQLSFAVTKKDNSNILALEGAWQINKNQQITYTYQRTDLKTKSKSSSVITFSGFWQVRRKNRLAYILSGGSGSVFDFRVQLETPNVYPQKGVLKYRLGIGARKRLVSPKKIIFLYGTWKIGRDIGLLFEMEYAQTKFYAMEFGAEVRFRGNNQIAFNLKSRAGEDLGISIVFTHRFLKQLDTELFLRLKYSRQEQGADMGLRFPF